MIHRLRLPVLLAILAGTPAQAQDQPAVPRAIPLPDTLGANFDVADTLTATSGPGDYDFLVGTWRFTFQARREDGSFTPPFTGHWVFSRKQTGGQGVLIEDHWRPDDPSATWDAGTWTYRAYNPRRRLWEMQGINTNVGAWQPGLMWTAGDSRLLTEWYGSMLVRFRYFAIQPDSFLWRADATFDRGRTWILDHWTMQAHRVSR
ncbi:MAG TPA: hypothetical protein VFO06_02735 [Gemmatimonadales bacterium]|nr:hypothetical protein [Gemmatimonadales bacterium]